MIKYSKQFKLSAIQAFLGRGRGFRAIAEQFHLDPSLLRRWVQAYRLHGEASLQGRGKDHSPGFKLSILEHMWREKLSLRQTAALFNVGNSTQIAAWQSRYYSGGIEALSTGKKGPYTRMPKPPKPRKPLIQPDQTPSAADEQLSHAELLDKLRWAQAEIAVLKKLEALSEEKAKKRQAEKKKPG